MINLNKYINLSSSKNIRLLLWFSGSLFFLGFFLKITFVLLEFKNFQSIDEPILLFIGKNLRTPLLNGTAVDLTALGSPALISIVSMITLVSLLISRDRIGALFLALNVIGGTLCMAVLKNLIGRPRPSVIPHLVEVAGRSYPSGHSLVSTVTYLSIAFLICRHLNSKRIIFTVLLFASTIILLIAFSRLYLGVHYPSDVFSGVLFGLAWVLLLTALFKTFKKQQQIPNLNTQVNLK